MEKNMKKCLIICWFGKIPDYYELWKCSCKNNPNYDFLIFTDQNLKSDMKNLKIINIKFEQIKKLIEKKLEIKVSFSKPYKFCDFRPAYGVIFEDYIKDYDYWGHCDLDQVFGKISNFIPDKTIKQFDKINRNGHFVLYKNTEEMNNIFRKSGAVFDWKEVFENKENYAFDEYTGINKIIDKNNVLQYSSNEYADIDKRHKRYKTINHQNWKKQIFVLENGYIYRYAYINGVIEKKDAFFYLHFQKKKPIIDKNIDYNKKIVMGCNKFSNVDKITYETFDEFNTSKSTMTENLELIKYYYFKVLEFLESTKAEKRIKKMQKGV